MESSSNSAESDPANDSAAEAKLTEFIAANRQTTPPPQPAFVRLAERLQSELVEDDAQRIERERIEAQRAGVRRVSEIRQRFHDVLLAAGDRYRDCTLDSFEAVAPQQIKVVAALREYVASDCPQNLILYGPVGTGKDHLAFAVCRGAIRAGKIVGWVNGQKWFGLLRDAMDGDTREATIIDDLRRPDILCVSDPLPPVGPLTQYQATMLYRLIDARYARGVPTICTVNVASDTEADERMGAASWDRLCDRSWKLRCAWPTFRRPAREV